MKYIAYCRKSTDEKDKQVLSIEQQLAELKEFANREHLEIVDFITEAKTAKVPGRKQFELLLRRIEKGEAQGIVSWHPDRLARNSIDGGKIIYLLDTGELKDLKFPSFWFESTPQGKFMLNIAFGQSKYYVDNLSENVARGMRYKINNGIWPVKAPIGYINDSSTRTIQIDSGRSKIIKKAFQVFAEGNEHSSSSNKSFTDIAHLLHKLGIATSKGKSLKPDQVKRILSNRFYIGIMEYVGEYHQGIHKLFISKELFDRVQKKIKLAERPTRKGKHEFAFTQLIKCGECEATVTAEKKIKFYKGTNRTAEYIYYRCTKKLKPCSQKPVTELELESQIRKSIDDVALPESWANDWYRWLERDEIEEQSNSKQNIQKLQLELVTLDKKLNILLDSYLEQVIDADTYKNKKNEFFNEKLKINEELEKIKTGGSSWLEPFKNFIGSALSCAKIARAKNTSEELAFFAKTVGSNFLLTNRQLSLNYNQGFASLASRRAALCAPPPAQSQSSQDFKKSRSVDKTGLEPVTCRV